MIAVMFLFPLIAAATGGAAELAAGTDWVTWEARAPVRFSIRTYAADVEIVASGSKTLSVAAPGAVRLVSGGGDRVEVEFGGKRQLHDGKVRVSLPRGSAVDVGAVSGSVTVAALAGEARVRGMSGRISVTGAVDVDVESVDGPVEITAPGGAVRIHTVSGATSVISPPPSIRLEVETASGPLDFRGPCGTGCHIDVDSVSGDVRFALDATSSAAARVVSTSGKVRDETGLSLRRKPGASEGDFSEGTIGRGDGLIECETFSGNVTFASR